MCVNILLSMANNIMKVLVMFTKWPHPSGIKSLLLQPLLGNPRTPPYEPKAFLTGDLALRPASERRFSYWWLHLRTPTRSPWTFAARPLLYRFLNSFKAQIPCLQLRNAKKFHLLTVKDHKITYLSSCNCHRINFKKYYCDVLSSCSPGCQGERDGRLEQLFPDAKEGVPNDQKILSNLLNQEFRTQYYSPRGFCRDLLS